MLFQMLTGVLPFRGDSMAELMYKIAQEEAPDIRVMRKDIPERLATVVALSLSKRPETRYQDGDQFAADLRSVLGALSGLAPRQRAPAQQHGAGPDTDAFEKTAVIRPGAPGYPASADGTTDVGA
jgi:serine/threonine-protein kinase